MVVIDKILFGVMVCVQATYSSAVAQYKSNAINIPLEENSNTNEIIFQPYVKKVPDVEFSEIEFNDERLSELFPDFSAKGRTRVLYKDKENRERESKKKSKHFLDLSSVRKKKKDFSKSTQSKINCFACRYIMRDFVKIAENGGTEDKIGIHMEQMCKLFQLQTPFVCKGIAETKKKELHTVLNSITLSPKEICSFLYSGCGENEYTWYNWTVPLPTYPKPPVSEPLPPKPGSPVLKVLHLADIHIDPKYQEGSNANCKNLVCCRNDSGKPVIPEDAAGYWGDYRSCDIPLRTLIHMLDHINKTHKFDYVIWTGDIPPHNVWETSRLECIHLLHKITDLLTKYLGHLPIFPSLGNHESSPVNSFPIPLIKGTESISWLYDEVEKAWSNWIPSQSTIKFGGYYSALIFPGFRIISLNSNYCNRGNLWLLINPTDPGEELAWLTTQLQLAELNGEKVHIIGHIAPDDPDCFGVWGSNYYRIINRYENTVAAQFFGHQHPDMFEIFYDSSDTMPRPTNIAYFGPSITTYTGLNPGYRIYTVDGNYSKSSYAVLDHETYVANLTESNLYMTLKWKLEYSAKKAYNLKSLWPKDWDKLVDKFETDQDMFDKFYLYYHKMSDYDDIQECDETCKQELLCSLRRGKFNDTYFCP